MIISEFDCTKKFLYKVDELRAVSGHMLRTSKVQIPENNLDNLHSIIEDGTLELMDLQELLDLSVLLSIRIGSLRGTIVVVAILVQGHKFPTNVKVRPVDLDFILAFTELIYANEMTLVSITLFFLFKLGCDLLAIESKFTPVEKSTGVLETTFVEDVVLNKITSINPIRIQKTRTKHQAEYQTTKTEYTITSTRKNELVMTKDGRNKIKKQ
nr:hypothetical protein [Tanacetum cinerariifolium]